MELTSEYLDQSFDDIFHAIQGNKWLPWVGRDYQGAQTKVLVLGESVYNWKKGSDEHFEKISQKESLRDIHLKHAFDFNRKSKFVRNIERAIFNKRKPSVEEKTRLWSSVVYHNLVLRVMKTKKHRPNYDDYYAGWAVVDLLVEKLGVDQILVYGLERSKLDALKDYALAQGIELNCVEENSRIGRSVPKVLTLKKGDRTLKVVFIRHPSSYFSWKKWAPVLNRHFDGVWQISLVG